MTSFPTSEKRLSQIPALEQLIKLGYQYLSSEQVWQQRRQSSSNVLLEEILHTQLGKINRIRHKGSEYEFSEANIEEAIQKLNRVIGDRPRLKKAGGSLKNAVFP